MSYIFRLPLKISLLAALLISAPLSAASSNDSTRWLCKADSAGGWQCGGTKPADGLGTRFVAPQRTAVVAPDTSAPYKIDGEQLDWVPSAALSEEQQLTLPGYCPGGYVEPTYVAAEQSLLNPGSQPTQGSANASQTDENGVTTLTGNVVLTQGYRQIKSEQAVLDRKAGTAEFIGRTQFREPGILLIGEDPQVNLNSNEITFNDAQFVAHNSHIRGDAEKLNRQTDGIIRVDQGSLTYCAPGSNTWAVEGSEVRLDQEKGYATIKHARLKIKDVPVFYFPWARFPLDKSRQSGFLTPDIGSSDGIDIATPYYWNIAPNYDATLTPRYIGDRGALGEAELRYLHNNNHGEIGAAFLASDDLFQNQDRWLGSVTHKGTLFNSINTRVDYTTVSDGDYFGDLGTDLNASSQTNLLRLAEASYNGKHWDITARTQSYQTIDSAITDANKPYDRLPQIIANGFYPYNASGFELGLMAEYSNFDRDNSGLTGIDRAVGHRTRVAPSVSWLFETPYAYIKPKATYHYTRYQLNDLVAGLNNSPDISVPVFSIDSGLFFERDTSWAGKAATQTFEPRFFYLKVPEEKGQLENPLFDTSALDFSYSQLFRENRFTGGDRIADADQFSLGLTTRLIDHGGFERARASIGQIFYDDNRSVTLTNTPAHTDTTSDSPIAAELMYALKSGWRLQGDIEWDPDLSSTNQSSLNLRYHGDNQHILNIGYRVRNDGSERLEQTDISAAFPVSKHWSVVSRWNHDLIRDRLVEAFAGFEYQSCCWAVRVIGRRWINDDDINASDGVDEKNAIYIQFELKGLGKIGDSTERLFSDSIPGYQLDK